MLATLYYVNKNGERINIKANMSITKLILNTQQNAELCNTRLTFTTRASVNEHSILIEEIKCLLHRK